VGPIDFVLIVLIFGEFFLFMAIASYFGKRKEKREKTKTITKKREGINFWVGLFFSQFEVVS
jgi:hypothetical protein